MWPTRDLQTARSCPFLPCSLMMVPIVQVSRLLSRGSILLGCLTKAGGGHRKEFFFLAEGGAGGFDSLLGGGGFNATKYNFPKNLQKLNSQHVVQMIRPQKNNFPKNPQKLNSRHVVQIIFQKSSAQRRLDMLRSMLYKSRIVICC